MISLVFNNINSVNDYGLTKKDVIDGFTRAINDDKNIAIMTDDRNKITLLIGKPCKDKNDDIILNMDLTDEECAVIAGKRKGV